jgi:iron-sulfur cluster assembly accessory protein
METAPVSQTEVVHLTSAAAEQIRAMWSADPANAGKPLRVYVEAGGCSGRRYEMIFDQARPGDAAAEFFGVAVVVDAVSAQSLQGSVLDFSDSLTGGGFKLNNPNARESCGCGKSFAGP